MLLTVLFPCERDETTGIIVSNSMTVNLIINLYSTAEQNVKYGEGLVSSDNKQYSSTIMDLKLDVYNQPIILKKKLPAILLDLMEEDLWVVIKGC
jgi:hypothetical protein